MQGTTERGRLDARFSAPCALPTRVMNLRQERDRLFSGWRQRPPARDLGFNRAQDFFSFRRFWQMLIRSCELIAHHSEMISRSGMILALGRVLLSEGRARRSERGLWHLRIVIEQLPQRSLIEVMIESCGAHRAKASTPTADLPR